MARARGDRAATRPSRAGLLHRRPAQRGARPQSGTAPVGGWELGLWACWRQWKFTSTSAGTRVKWKRKCENEDSRLFCAFAMQH